VAESLPPRKVPSKIQAITKDWIALLNKAKAGDDVAVQLLVWMSSSGVETLSEMVQNPALLAKLQTHARHRTDWPMLMDVHANLTEIRRRLTELKIAEALPFVRGPEARVIPDDSAAKLLRELVLKVWDVGQWYKRMQGLVLMDAQACPYKEWPAYAERASKLPELSKDPATLKLWMGCLMTAFDLTYPRPSRSKRLCALAPNCISNGDIRHAVVKDLRRKLRGMVRR
jgi:hypothetical protein